MRKITNPFKDLPGYNCFGCSPGNAHGLRMTFYEEGDEIISRWDPKERFQGYLNVLHGGIQAALMDEIASWTVYVKAKRAGVTSKMEIRYFRPVDASGGTLTLTAKLEGMRRNLADILVRLFDPERNLCAEARITYFTYSEQKSRESLYYPEHGKFFGE